MRWLWQNYNPETRYRASAAPASPALEDQGAEEKGGRLINPLLRFRPIFSPLYKAAEQSGLAPDALIENLFFHILAHADRLSGIHCESLRRHALARALREGQYGEQARDLFAGLERKQQEIILDFLDRQQQEGGRRLLFQDCMSALLPESIFYYYPQDDAYLFYIDRKENEADRRLLALLEILFWDLACKKRKYYWQRHFGIIGEPATMRIGRLRIY